MKKVYVFLAEGFEEMEAVTPVDLLRRVGVDAKLVSVTGDKAVTGAHGITYQADLLFEEIEDADMLVLPGGMPGTLNLAADKVVNAFIDYAHKNDKYLAAICAAPSVLGGLGLLKEKEATCYPGFEDKLTGAKLSDKKVAVDGKIITARGMGVSLGFGLALVEALTDKATADGLHAAVQAD